MYACRISPPLYSLMPSNLSISSINPSIHPSVRQTNPSWWLGAEAGGPGIAFGGGGGGGSLSLLALLWFNGLGLYGARPYGLGRAQRGGLVGFGAVRRAALVIGGHAVHGLDAARLHPDC